MKHRKTRKTIVAAVRIEPELYRYAMAKVFNEDNNFSRYVRSLIRKDIGGTGEGQPAAAR